MLVFLFCLFFFAFYTFCILPSRSSFIIVSLKWNRYLDTFFIIEVFCTTITFRFIIITRTSTYKPGPDTINLFLYFVPYLCIKPIQLYSRFSYMEQKLEHCLHYRGKLSHHNFQAHHHHEDIHLQTSTRMDKS